MVKLTSYGNVKDGKLTIANRRRFNADIATFKNCAVEITVKKKNTRSLPQNSYYHGVVVQEVRLGLIEVGYRMSHDEVHYFLKQKFNSIEVPNKDGQALEMPGSTAELNKSEFSDYVARISEWASEYLGVAIPLPGQLMEIIF